MGMGARGSKLYGFQVRCVGQAKIGFQPAQSQPTEVAF